MTGSDQQHDQVNHDEMADLLITGMVATIAMDALKAATDEGFREDIHRRRELREELGAPQWVPHAVEPYYNIATWSGRVAFLVGELSVKSPVNWYRYPVLRTLAHWSIGHECPTRWELHEDWPER